jgi:hypothetical protein
VLTQHVMFFYLIPSSKKCHASLLHLNSYTIEFRPGESDRVSVVVHLGYAD